MAAAPTKPIARNAAAAKPVSRGAALAEALVLAAVADGLVGPMESDPVVLLRAASVIVDFVTSVKHKVWGSSDSKRLWNWLHDKRMSSRGVILLSCHNRTSFW